MTDIEWTQRPGTKGETWNPVVGCRRVSPGCERCYAETMAKRLSAMGTRRYVGLVNDRGRWTGEARLVPEVLDKPLRWRKPRTVFVNSMSDLFHEDVPFEYIAAVFGVMAACRQHTFIVLTKRPERELEFFAWLRLQYNCVGRPLPRLECCWQALRAEVEHHPDGDGGPLHTKACAEPDGPWPLPNVWLGVSAEDQPRADQRIPLLLKCPAAVRFVSAEPLLGPVDIAPEWLGFGEHGPLDRRVDWVIVGGESGVVARPSNIRWHRSIVQQCTEAGVPVFVKQLGANPYNCAGHDCPAACNCGGPHECYGGIERCAVQISHRKGADMSEWPADLRIREWPEVPA